MSAARVSMTCRSHSIAILAPQDKNCWREYAWLDPD
jgi:hypothetical protein